MSPDPAHPDVAQPKHRETYAFGPFRLDATGGVLYRGSDPVSLAPKQIATLIVLVRARGEVVDRESLVSQVWPDTFVEEAGLTRNVSMLRKAIESGDESIIETIPKRGYRFVAPVQEVIAGPERLQIVERVTSVQVIEEQVDEPAAPLLRLAPPSGARRRWPLAMAAVGVIIAGVAGWQWLRPPPEALTTSGTIRSIAVLPFRHLNPTPEDAHLGVGLADVLTTRFANLSSIVVRPTTSVIPYLGRESLAAGAALGVDAVLDGTIRHSDQRFRITVQLLSVATGRPLWAGTFDETTEELLAVEDGVATAVASLLVPGLSREAGARVARRTTSNPIAWRHYLRGRSLWATRGYPDVNQSVDEFELAIKADPGFALAYAGKATSQIVQGTYQYLKPRDVYPAAREAATRALELDPLLADAHGALGGIALVYDWDWPSAERAMRRSLSLNPNDPSLHSSLSGYLMAMGRREESLQSGRRAVALDPKSFALNSSLALMLNWAHRFEESIAQAEVAMALPGNIAMPALYSSASHFLLGRYDEGRAMLEKARSLVGEIPVVTAFTARYEIAAGRTDQGRALLHQLEQRRAREIVEPIFIAAPLVALGDTDRAIYWLQQAVADRSGYVPYFAIDPSFDPLHEEPGFIDLMKMLGLTEALARGNPRQ